MICIASGIFLAGAAALKASLWDCRCLQAGLVAGVAIGIDRIMPCSRVEDDTILRRLPWLATWHVFAGEFARRLFELHAEVESELENTLRSKGCDEKAQV